MKLYWECGRKRPHATLDAAERMAARIRHNTKGGSVLAPYRCPHCGQWHLAHRVRRILRTSWTCASSRVC